MPSRRNYSGISMDRRGWAYGPAPIGIIIKWIRKKHLGWSRRQLAMRSGVNKHTIIRIEDGTVQTPRWTTVAMLLRGMGVSLDEARKKEEKLIQWMEEHRQIVWTGGIPRTIKEEYVDLYWEARERAGDKWREYIAAEIARRQAEEAGREQQQDAGSGRSESAPEGVRFIGDGNWGPAATGTDPGATGDRPAGEGLAGDPRP